MDIKKLIVTVITALTIGVLSWQLNTVNKLETDVEIMKYQIEEIEKDIKSLKKKRKSKWHTKLKYYINSGLDKRFLSCIMRTIQLLFIQQGKESDYD